MSTVSSSTSAPHDNVAARTRSKKKRQQTEIRKTTQATAKLPRTAGAATSKKKQKKSKKKKKKKPENSAIRIRVVAPGKNSSCVRGDFFFTVASDKSERIYRSGSDVITVNRNDSLVVWTEACFSERQLTDMGGKVDANTDLPETDEPSDGNDDDGDDDPDGPCYRSMVGKAMYVSSLADRRSSEGFEDAADVTTSWGHKRSGRTFMLGDDDDDARQREPDLYHWQRSRVVGLRYPKPTARASVPNSTGITWDEMCLVQSEVGPDGVIAVFAGVFVD
jgi:hypothetical protein